MRRSCCRVVVIVIVVVVFVAVAIVEGAYKPQFPTFSITDIDLTTFDLSYADELFFTLDVKVSTRNPSKLHFSYMYDIISISAFNGEMLLGNGSFPAFVHSSGKTEELTASLRSVAGEELDARDAVELREKENLMVRIEMESKIRTMIGIVHSPKQKIKVGCGAFLVPVPDVGYTSATSTSREKTSCRVETKFWKWYI